MGAFRLLPKEDSEYHWKISLGSTFSTQPSGTTLCTTVQCLETTQLYGSLDGQCYQLVSTGGLGLAQVSQECREPSLADRQAPFLSDRSSKRSVDKVGQIMRRRVGRIGSKL